MDKARQEAREDPERKERRWIEAEEEDHDDGKRAEDDYRYGDDFGGLGELFADPDPDESFVRAYSIRRSRRREAEEAEEEDGTTTTKTVTIKLRGIKAENGQTLRSTGLTMWRASEAMCAYLVKHPEMVAGRSVLEV